MGRDEELESLDDLAQLAFASGLRVALVTGAAGLGKSRLVAEAVRAQARGVTVLTARAYRWGTTASFGVWIEAFERFLRGCSEDERREVCGPFLADLAGFIPTLRGLGNEVDHQPSRERMVSALVGFVDRLGQRAPALLAFDDVHLADSASWETLRVLGRRLSDAPVALFATARPQELRDQPTASEVIVGLEEDGLLRRIPLRALTRPEIAELAHDILRSEPGDRPSFVTEPLVSWLAERSLGHPLFVVSLLRALVEEGADLAAPTLDRVPESLRERVALDLHGLDRAHREVLEVLAVMDTRAEASEVLMATGRPPAELEGSLERLVADRLVAEHGAGADVRYEVAHPIIQDAIYEGIGSVRRAALHRAVAEALTETGRLGSAAAHLARAGVTDDSGVETLFVAMEQAQARDLYQEALAILGALLDVLPPGDRRWLRLVETLTWESDWVLSHLAENDADTAIAAMERALDVSRASADRTAEATVQFHLAAFLSLCAARYEDATAACKASIELFEAVGDDDGALVARNELAWIHGGRGDLSTHAATAMAVHAAARADGRVGPSLHAAGTAAYALALRGKFEESARYYDLAIDLADDAANTYRAVWARAQRGICLCLAGELDRAVESVEEALRLDPSAAPDALALEDLAHCFWLGGRLSEGVAAIERSAVRRPVNGSRRRAWGSALAARMYAEMGHGGRARAAWERAAGTYANRTTLAWSSWPTWTEGFLAWQDGDSATAVERLAATVDRLRGIGARAYEILVLADVAEVAADAGNPERCDEAAARARELAGAIGGLLPEHLADLASAWACFSRRAEPASDLAAAAAEGFASAGYGLLAATAHAVCGRSAGRDDRASAVQHLERAAAGFDRCGAVWRRDRVVAELREHGHRGRRAAAAVQGPAALTARERQVAELAASGHTAREIGETLFIGTRTVETHLASIYAKLGIRSKRELVRRADELGP